MTENQKALLQIAMDAERADKFYYYLGLEMYEKRAKWGVLCLLSFGLGWLIGLLRGAAQ
jgi:hypothetical protein